MIEYLTVFESRQTMGCIPCPVDSPTCNPNVPTCSPNKPGKMGDADVEK